MSELFKMEPIILEKHSEYNEKWLQEQIARDPAIIGLGDLELIGKERTQPTGGRLDLLLQDDSGDTPKRYECEIQLGATNESHIIRTIEYWDIERRRYPQYDHTAVLIAEDVTRRFLNVIHLFNGHIPLILIKMTAYKINNSIGLTFTKILDEVELGLPDDDNLKAEPTDKPYWEKRSNKLKLFDALFDLVKEVEEQDIKPNYNKYYIGISRNNQASNYLIFKPKKGFVKMISRFIPDETILNSLQEAGLEVTTRGNWITIRFNEKPTEQQKEPIKKMIKWAQENYFR